MAYGCVSRLCELTCVLWAQQEGLALNLHHKCLCVYSIPHTRSITASPSARDICLHCALFSTYPHTCLIWANEGRCANELTCHSACSTPTHASRFPPGMWAPGDAVPHYLSILRPINSSGNMTGSFFPSSCSQCWGPSWVGDVLLPLEISSFNDWLTYRLPPQALRHLLLNVTVQPVYNGCFSEIISSFPSIKIGKCTERDICLS